MRNLSTPKRALLGSLVVATALAASGSTLAGESDKAKKPMVVSTSPDYSKSMEQLQQATQKLREAIQQMAQEPAGDRRNRAIGQAQEALVETQRSMMALPPELRVGSASSPDYTKSMERLQTAAQKLRDATHAMAQQPAGERRNKAIDQANQALYDTQQAMIALPADMRTK